MCELLVRVFDKVTDAPTPAFKAGDVLHIAEDGCYWGPGDLSNPDWRIVKAPGISVEAMTGYLQSLQTIGGTLAAKRAQGFDLESALGVLLRGSAVPFVLRRSTLIEALALTVQRADSTEIQ